MGCHFLVQGIFSTQGLNWCLDHLSPALQAVSCIAGGFFTDWTTWEARIRGKALLSIKVFCKLVLSLLLVFPYLLVFKDCPNTFLFIYPCLLTEFHFGRNVLLVLFYFSVFPSTSCGTSPAALLLLILVLLTWSYLTSTPHSDKNKLPQPLFSIIATTDSQQ